MQKEQQPSKWESEFDKEFNFIEDRNPDRGERYFDVRASIKSFIRSHLTALGEEVMGAIPEQRGVNGRAELARLSQMVKGQIGGFNKCVTDTRTAISKVFEQHGVKIK